MTRILLGHALTMAEEIRAAAVFLYAEALPEGWQAPDSFGPTVYLVARGHEERETLEAAGHRVIQAPNVELTRLGQVKLAVLVALARGLLTPGDRLLCLSGIVHSASLDTLVIMEVSSEYELFMAPSGQEAKAPRVRPEILLRAIDIAVELGAEGREGKPVGALFVIGDTESVMALSRQLILNPFRGYPEDERNVLDDRLIETVKELATIDGAFIVRGNGVLVSAGAYIHATSDKEMLRGLGARHHAAAGITEMTEAIAVAVSESTGTVTVFRKGQVVVRIERGTRRTARLW